MKLSVIFACLLGISFAAPARASTKEATAETPRKAENMMEGRTAELEQSTEQLEATEPSWLLTVGTSAGLSLVTVGTLTAWQYGLNPYSLALILSGAPFSYSKLPVCF